MESDEQPNIVDPDEAAWAAAERQSVINYLSAEKVDHAGVSLEPRWFLSPFIAIWAVRSKTLPDRIGWWAISGDLPTDYITCNHERGDADVLLSFSCTWRKLAADMAAGIPRPDYQIGPPGREKEFAPMLLARAEMLEHFAKDMKRAAHDY